MFTPFLVALQFLTTCPIQLKQVPSPDTLGKSLAYYPVVGLLIGLLLWLLAYMLMGMAPALVAIILLLVWVSLTGGLHLDGLADSLDGFAAGHRQPERILEVMKDPSCGAMAVIGLVLVLLLKFVALTEILVSNSCAGLLVAPLLGRSGAVMLLLTTDYVRADGIGRAMVQHCRRYHCGWMLAAAAGFTLLVIDGGLLVLLTASVAWFWLRHRMLKRIAGTTGDTAGAMIELLETLVLVTIVALSTATG